MTAPRRDRRFPDGPQLLALHAAVDERSSAEAAWSTFLAEVDLAELWDAEVYRLMPLVWRNLGDGAGAEADRLKGMYRRGWVQNQTLLHHAGAILAALGEAEIDVLTLKGVPLLLDYYGDIGARPMGDVDLLVPVEQAVAVFRVLEALGYESVSIRPPTASRWEREGDDDWYTRLRHARGYQRSVTDAVDIHWRLSLDFVGDDAQVADMREFWAASRPAMVGDVKTATLAPAHHLFHALVHGLGASPTAILRWIPDALRIIAVAGDDLEWDPVIGAAARHRCSLAVAAGLAYLAEEFAAPVPDHVLPTLRRIPVGRRERTLDRLRSRPTGGLLGSGYAAGLFLTSTAGCGPARTAVRAPGFLTDYWNVAHVHHVPLIVAHKARRSGRAEASA